VPHFYLKSFDHGNPLGLPNELMISWMRSHKRSEIRLEARI